jgi:fatty acid desaturase
VNVAAIKAETTKAEPGTAEAGLSRQANDLARDLMRADPRIYWFDLIATSLVTYASLAAALASPWPAVAVAAGAVCVLALYRAVSFIHELTHLRPGEVPGFHTGWNVLVGVPFLTPSLLYEGVHMQHHAKDRYGTAADPEYLPLARLPASRLAAFLAVALLAPVGVFLRFAVLAPLSFLAPPLRRVVVAKMSAMTINPAFARDDLARATSPAWLAQEVACWLWSWTLIGLVLAGLMPLRWLLTGLAIFGLFAFLNQVRTAVAHAWENAGDKMSFAGQFHDTVNVPPPALLPGLWAPVGLRYHALHHLLPRLPYHNLGKAHRRLAAGLPAAYRRVEQPGLAAALGSLVRKARGSARAA